MYVYKLSYIHYNLSLIYDASLCFEFHVASHYHFIFINIYLRRHVNFILVNVSVTYIPRCFFCSINDGLLVFIISGYLEDSILLLLTCFYHCGFLKQILNFSKSRMENLNLTSIKLSILLLLPHLPFTKSLVNIT